MSRVNPPPHRRIPAKISRDPELRGYFEDLEFNLFQMWQRMGGEVDAVASANERQSVHLAQIDALQTAVNGGDALTSDEAGFTVDTIKLTVDMEEA